MTLMPLIVFGGTIFFSACSGLQVAGQLHAGRNALQTGRPQEAIAYLAPAAEIAPSYRLTYRAGESVLEYLAPRNGRPAPGDTRSNDIWHWQTRLATTSVDEAFKKHRAKASRIVSPAIAAMPDKGLGFAKGFLARDPDGHGLQFVEK